MKRLPFSCLMLVFLIAGALSTFTAAFGQDILTHRLSVELDPMRKFIKAEDRIEVRLREKGPSGISLMLHSGLKVTRVADSRTGESLQWKEIPFSRGVKSLDVSLKEGSPLSSISISYEGQIYDPVVKERALQFVRGDETTGLISLEGVYLSGSSYWYPDRPDSLATFEVEATIAEPFRIVTQGELVSEELKSGLWKTRWRNDLPAESLTLVAGDYVIKNRVIDGVKLSTYFFKEDDRFSDLFLDGAADYLKLYTGLLGPFPYKKFDIVQNFFSSGYGIPTFTLLAPETIRQGKEFLRPGALDHEIVHSWWGHAVSVKPGRGNWVEALTTYCTNYYYKEWQIGEDAARKHRQDVMLKYAIQVDPKRDYPLGDFEGKAEELDGEIGYGKGSMVFHMLRRKVGEDLFFSTLRKFSSRYRGKQAGWKEIRETFEEATGETLEPFFSQWLNRAGGPKLKLGKVRHRVSPKGYVVSAEVIQEGDVYQLQLPIEVDLGREKKTFLADVSEQSGLFSMEVPTMPLKVSIDPAHHVFRRLSPEEILPCLNAYLSDREKIFVLPDSNREDAGRRKIYSDLADMAKQNKGGRVLSSGELTDGDIRNSSLMLLGESWKSPALSALLSSLPLPFQVKGDSLLFDGKRVGEEDEALLLTLPHPHRRDKWVSIYFGSSAAALSRARYIFFYGWDSYILFKKGRPQERGSFLPVDSPLVYGFLSDDAAGRVDARRLKDTITHLSSPALAGRLSGTDGYQEVQPYLLRLLVNRKIQPMLQRFSFFVKDIESAQLAVHASAGRESFTVVPFRYSKQGEWRGPCLLDRDDSAGPLDDIYGKAVAFFYCSQCHEAEAREFLLSRIADLQLRGASALLVLIKEEDLEHLGPYMTYPSFFPPQVEKRLKARERDGTAFNRLIEASKIASKAAAPGFPVDLPVLFVLQSEAEEERIRRLFAQKEVPVELLVHFEDKKIEDANIAGIIEGNDPQLKKEFIVLGAHYDHLGRDEKSGSYYPGADDNGSGVAAVLEIGRLLVEKKADLKRSLLILLFGGEEWGLMGSGHYVKEPLIPLQEIKAMLSLDTIGGSGGAKEVFIVGKTKYPSLAERAGKYLGRLGLKEGKDIDAYAFAYGSDHFPFHQAGIPAIDFFASDYRKLHSLHDKPELIDFDKLTDVTRAIYWTVYEMLTEP